MTGLANFEPSMGGKWLQTLKEIAPQLTRVGVLRVAETQVRILQNIKDYAASSGMEAVDCPVRDGPGIRAAIGAFDGQPATGLIVLPDPVFSTYRALIFELAANQHHPAIYAAPQTVQTASPVCGAKNFVLVRLYSAPQLIGQLSPFPEYAPKARAIKPDSAATIKLTNYRREGNT